MILFNFRFIVRTVLVTSCVTEGSLFPEPDSHFFLLEKNDSFDRLVTILPKCQIRPRGQVDLLIQAQASAIRPYNLFNLLKNVSFFS